MSKAEAGVGAKKNGLLKGAALVLVAGVALSMAGCSREEPPKPQGTVDISGVPSPSSIDTPTSTTSASESEGNGGGSGSEDKCEAGTSFDVGDVRQNIAYLGRICFSQPDLQSDLWAPEEPGTPGYRWGWNQKPYPIVQSTSTGKYVAFEPIAGKSLVDGVRIQQVEE